MSESENTLYEGVKTFPSREKPKEEKLESRLQNSYQIVYSLNSNGIQLQKMDQTSRKLEDHIGIALKHSEAVYEQSKKQFMNNPRSS